MKITLVHFCILTLVLLMCCFTVEATMGRTKKCKPPLKYAPKLKKCIKVKPKKKTTPAAGSATGTPAATTAAAA
ncbi:uncharacterized protein LOC122617775 [Drosophila teissieri]|uniref:uncharacterized protein LOC122617775 n=1 Tax=Drosophila teissieri TaxID=7243 RepID=UPI001CBA3377|nr:uncharacterized protein LOC122617775 [Drosophila teissieri]